MNTYKLESSTLRSRKTNIQVGTVAKAFLRISYLVIGLTFTIGTTSLQAQFSTTFWPARFNPTDPGNTNWNEPKNWSWYPGNNIANNIVISIHSTADNYVQLNIPSTSVINILSNAELRTHALLINEGRISGEGTLKLLDTGVNRYSSSKINCKSLIGDYISNSGTIDCEFINANSIVGGENSNDAGTVICNQDCNVSLQVRNSRGKVENNGNLNGWVQLLGGGIFENKRNFRGNIVTLNLFGRVINTGNIEINSPSYSYIARLENMPGSKITINSSLEIGGRISNNGTIVNNALMDIRRNSSISGDQYFNNRGTITNNSENMIINSNITLDNTNGIIKGSGTVKSATVFTNTGSISPGNSPGHLNHVGPYVERGILQIELGGTSAGSSYDVHSILGSYSHAGATLNVSLIDGFIPEAGNSFRIVNASSRIGNFSSVNLPSLSPGLEWEVEYNPTNITLRVTSNIVPVTWLDFNITTDQRENGSAKLAWSTAEEVINLGFEVERSADGRIWEQIGFEAASTKTADQHDYEYIDLNPENGINYYRLKQIDHDGAYEYSVVRTIEHKSNKSSFSVFPNPSSSGLLQLTFEQKTKENLSLTIRDLSGRIVSLQAINANGDTSHLTLTTVDLIPGTYIITLKGRNYQSNQKWVKI